MIPRSFAWRAALVVLGGLLSYGMTVRNRYALDDELVLSNNIAVQQPVTQP